MSDAISFQHYEKSRRDLLRSLRAVFAFCLGVLLATWVCFANAAMTGYIYDNRCIQTQSEVLEAFKFRSQYLETGQDYEVCGGAYAPTIATNMSYTGQSAPLAIKYYVAQGSYSDQCMVSVAKYIGLPPCDPDTQTLAFTGTNALFLVLGFFYAGMLGFKTGYRA